MNKDEIVEGVKFLKIRKIPLRFSRQSLATRKAKHMYDDKHEHSIKTEMQMENLKPFK